MYLELVISVFVMYYVYVTSRPSLLIESTDSIIMLEETQRDSYYN